MAPLRRYSFVAGTETGLLSLLFLFVPLYTRIKKEQALDHFVRGQIYEYIRVKPGQHYSAIKTHLKLKNGTLAYHLKTLEMQNFVKYRRIGLFKCFYPIDYKLPKGENAIRLSKLQVSILAEVRGKPGLSQTEIIERHHGSTQQNISYNLRVMEKSGLIRTEEAGRNVRYYAVEENDVEKAQDN